MGDQRTRVLNYGGGHQTVAMCLLVLQGALPRPDYIVIADTGREAQSTWDYLDQYVSPALASAGLQVHVAPHALARVDLYAADGQTILPAFTAQGKLLTFCSGEWKARVVQRWLRGRGVVGADQWIGFTLDERQRVKPTDDGPWVRRYPLLDLMLTRHDCEQVIVRAGLPLPETSACYMCPLRSNAEWRLIRDRYPAQWQAALAIDEEIREADDRGGLYLHHSRRPLAAADLEDDDRCAPARQCGLGWCLL